MTGRYPFHTGLGPDVICTSCGDAYGLPAREVLMPALLSKAGYTTAAIGKWHLYVHKQPALLGVKQRF